MLNEPVQERGGDHGRCHISRTPESSKKTGFGRGSSMAYLGSCDPPCKAPAFCEASGVAVTPPSRDSWRRSGEGGREGKQPRPQTRPSPRVPAGRGQLLVLFLFIPDLRCPFYFPPFKTWPGPRHRCCKHGPRDLSYGALTPAPCLTNHPAAHADSGQPSQRQAQGPGARGPWGGLSRAT